MLKLLITVWLFWAVVAQTERLRGSGEFCYDEDLKCGPTTWPGACLHGTSQSPINLTYVNTRSSETADLYQNADYFTKQNFYVQNNGQTVQASIKLDLTSRSTVTGSLLGKTYVFSQLHFHWGARDDIGSEHTLNGTDFQLESHLVHYASEFNGLNDAIKSQELGAVAVFATFFKVGDKDNKAFDPIISQFDKIKAAKTNTTGKLLNLSNFMPLLNKKPVKLLQYNGSLTTPTCDEVVLWNVFVKPAPISHKQLNAFRDLSSVHGGKLVNNFRPIQKRNDRAIKFIRTSVTSGRLNDY